MAFNINDIVKKKTGTQKYKVVQIEPNDKYGCKLQPPIGQITTYYFKEDVLELVS